MDAAIRCDALSKRYGDVTAVDNLNLSIPAGSVFGFLGRNGAGKTSTIRLLTGLMQATSGNAWINGVHATDPKSRHQFGYLPQEPAFYKWMTPIQFLNYIADLYQMGREKHRQIDEMLERVGLQNVSQRPIRGFSGGMVQRLGIAQAMLHRPPILFLDEPTSALDPSGRYELLTLIESLRGEITIFLSSHILADIERVCDTVAIINQGQLIRVENRDVLLNEFTTNRIHLEVHRASLPQVST
ncbi:MAG: ABC transporter ATP-binding protein, partial [Chloroflexota bacterium]